MTPNTINYPVNNYDSRGGSQVYWLAVHTAEGARTVESLGNFFRSIDNASSHAGIDHDTVAFYVNTKHRAWTLRNGNSVSDNVELCGFAAWTRDEWFNNQGMLDNLAWWLSERAAARDIPLKKLTLDEVANRKSGVIGHDDYTYATGDGSHTDPGENFPWDYVIEKAREYIGGYHYTGEKRKQEPMVINFPRTASDEVREEIVNLGYINGWNGRCVIRMTFGHPGGHVKLAHVEYPETSGNEMWLEDVDVEPVWRATNVLTFEPQTTGPGTLMVQYTATGGVSVNLEWEK